MKPTLLLSGCLSGQPVRYDGAARPLMHASLARWQAEGRVFAFCPETAAGLPTPRPPAESNRPLKAAVDHAAFL
ncbi:2-thiouracil desulfurase family protein [Komagataeibacter melaceti]|uniref:2-thiouracil desulfurase family protein n=1 Tax=Komagataeibacter melaceti TaxID=2766577 RepID=UPI00237C278E|nr:2-thiouracil desulfurase family protein [Komagataeibacter melaceti]